MAEVAHGLRRVQEAMAAGDVAGALVADGELAAATLANQPAGRVLDPPRAAAGRVQVRGAGLRRAHGGRMEAAMQFVRERPTCESQLTRAIADDPGASGEKRARPKGLNETALQVVRDGRGRVAKFHEG